MEKHYGKGDGNGENVMNPTTIVNIEEGGFMEMETVQIKGIDSTERVTSAKLDKDAKIVITERIMTHGKQHATTRFNVDMNGGRLQCKRYFPFSGKRRFKTDIFLGN